MSKQDLEPKDAMIEGAHPTLCELIKQQGVSPINDLDELSDLWPADDDPELLLRHVLEDRFERRRLDAEREQI